MGYQPDYDFYKKQLSILDSLLAGKKPASATDNSSVQKSSEQDEPDDALKAEFENKFLTLVTQINEISGFIQELSKGNLEAKVPSRRNYLAAPVKELHTQLLSLSYSMSQLADGNIVEDLKYQGELFKSFNSLITKVASVANKQEMDENADHVWDPFKNSWRYHGTLSAVDNLQFMLLEVTLDGDVYFANKPADDYFGRIKHLSNGPKNERSITGVLENYFLQINKDHASTDFPLIGEIYDEPNNCWYKITSDRVDVTSKESGILHMIENISEWKNNEKTLTHTASTDPLTGVYNRRYGMNALDEAVFGAKSGTPYSVAFLDLDGLKAINDKHGHGNGDYAIRTIAETIVSSVRDNRDTVCRFGGDEFIIIFRNLDKKTASLVIKRMLAKLGEINANHGKGFDLSFSYGIIELDAARDNDVRGIIDEIDQIMYENKAARKKELARSNP
jgi:diguanylate cyclase (GGDEF)-like protein